MHLFTNELSAKHLYAMQCVHVDAHYLTVTTNYIFNERYKTPTHRVLLGTVCNSLLTKVTLTNSYVKGQEGLAVSESQQIRLLLAQTKV